METVINSDPVHEIGKKRFIFRNLTQKEKQLLVPGGAGVLGLISGAGLDHYFGLKQDVTDFGTPVSETSVSSPSDVVCVYTEAPFAHSVSDDMSFNQAFSSAREELGMGGFFEWRGNTYNTYYKEEWDQLSPSEKQDYMVSVHESTDYNSLVNVDREDDVIYSDFSHDDHIGVEHVGAEDSSQSTEEDYEIVVFDLNDDHILDSVAIDLDQNGYVDALGVDVNQDGVLDIYALDTNDVDTLDTIILDANQDGLDAEDPAKPWDNDQEIRIDELRESIYPSHHEEDDSAGDQFDDDSHLHEIHSI